MYAKSSESTELDEIEITSYLIPIPKIKLPTTYRAILSLNPLLPGIPSILRRLSTSILSDIGSDIE